MVQAPGTIHVAKGSTSKAAWSLKRRVVLKRDAKWLPHLGLNPSASLPPQPHFWPLPQSATAASIPGRCGPVVWSQSSPSSSEPHYKSLFGAPLLAAPCYKSLLSHIQPLHNHIKDNGRRSHLLATTSGCRWTSSYLPLGQGCPERGGGAAWRESFLQGEGPYRIRVSRLSPGSCRLGVQRRALLDSWHPCCILEVTDLERELETQ